MKIVKLDSSYREDDGFSEYVITFTNEQKELITNCAKLFDGIAEHLNHSGVVYFRKSAFGFDDICLISDFLNNISKQI